jgi:hypothetical protein
LPAREFPIVHQSVEWMLVVVARGANGMESRNEFGLW